MTYIYIYIHIYTIYTIYIPTVLFFSVGLGGVRRAGWGWKMGDRTACTAGPTCVVHCAQVAFFVTTRGLLLLPVNVVVVGEVHDGELK